MDINDNPKMQYLDPRDYSVEDKREKALNDFLKKISMLESSGNKNVEHKVITDPESIHYDTSAVGQYGLMPVTAIDLDRKYKINQLKNLDKYEAQQKLEENPELANKIATEMAKDLLKRNTPEVSAYKWLHGMSSKPTEEELEESSRVQKFKALQNLK